MSRRIETDSGNLPGASAGQGRAKHGRALARRTLDGTHQSAGYNRAASRAIDFAYLKVVSLSMVLSHYGLLEQFKRSGAQLVGCCPIHQGSNRRQFVVHATSGNFFCFGDCNRGGAGPLDFVALRERVPVTRAAELIAQWFALSPSPGPTRPQPARRTAMNNRPSHRGFIVEDRDGDDKNEQPGFWIKVASAWPHKDGKGLNIQITPGISVSGKLVLREYTAEDEAADAKKTKRVK